MLQNKPTQAEIILLIYNLYQIREETFNSLTKILILISPQFYSNDLVNLKSLKISVINGTSDHQ